jgi:hypothetical protein
MGEFTQIETANINFYGNYCNFSMQLDELKIFLNEVCKFIDITNLNLQNNEIKGHDEETLENLKYHFQYTQGDILRKSIIISLIILLETTADTYCTTFKRFNELKIGYKDLKGDLLDRFKSFSVKVLGSSFDFQSSLWQDIVGLYEIRNSLVHNSGSLENFGKRKSIEDFVKRHKTFSIDDNDWIHISNKGCSEGLAMIDNFVRQVTQFGFNTFPGSYTWE